MNSLDDVKRCIGLPIRRKLKDHNNNEVEFEFQALGVESLPEISELQRRITKDPEEILKQENASLMVDLIKKMLKLSFTKDIPDDILSNFAFRNFLELSKIFMEVNSPVKIDDTSAELVHKKIKELQDARKSTSN